MRFCRVAILSPTLAGERGLRTRGLLLGGGGLVGSLLGQAERFQPCGLLPNGPRLRLVERPGFLGIVSRFLCLLGLRVALVASLRMISQGRLLVSAPERPCWATPMRRVPRRSQRLGGLPVSRS